MKVLPERGTADGYNEFARYFRMILYRKNAGRKTPPEVKIVHQMLWEKYDRCKIKGTPDFDHVSAFIDAEERDGG